MSVTIEQILELPSLRRANVLAGKKGLGKIVLSISVLECSKNTNVQKYLLDHIDYAGGELAITSFNEIRDDVEDQCNNIRSLANVGEVGLILFYVGIVMPCVDDKLLHVADEMDFPIICMPENDPTTRYSEVICEVMDAVIKDQMNWRNFSMDLLEQMSKLPVSQRTVDSMLYLVSGRLRATVVITDGRGQLLSMSTWPRNQKLDWEKLQKKIASPDKKIFPIKGDDHTIWVHWAELRSEIYHNMILYIFKESEMLESFLWKQTLDGIRLGMNLWGKEHDKLGLLELVRAIIQDEPIKMHRIADMYGIDVASISDMWIVHSLDEQNLALYVSRIRELSEQYVKVSICEPFENDILVFPKGQTSLNDMEEWSRALQSFCEKKKIKAAITHCNGLRDTADVKSAYYVNQAYIADAITIFPLQRIFSFPEIEFVKTCRRIADEGESSIDWYMSMLRQLSGGREGIEMVDTLTCFLLDKKTNITETAEALFVHKNTIKYRLQKAGSILGFRVGEMPSSQYLTYAVAIKRLLQIRER